MPSWVQLTSVELLQEVLAVGQLGTLGQTHLPFGKLPLHTRPDGQAAVAAAKQPLPSSVQVTTAPLPVSQYEPAEPDWQAVTVGQAQPADGKLPEQVCGEGQVLVVVVKQPLTTAQVTTVAEPALGQTVPAWFMHTAGGVGQTQAALGRLP
jgi:hypothetical protein